MKFRIHIGTIGAALLLLVLSCAYYNTLYNAEDKFAEAEKAMAAQTRAVEAAPGGVNAPGVNTQAAREAQRRQHIPLVLRKHPDVSERGLRYTHRVLDACQ